MDTIYQEILLDHYHNPRNRGRLAKPSKTVSIANPLCGDVIDMEIEFSNDKVANIKFQGHGCVISTAAASILTGYAKGKSKNELLKLNRGFMIKLLGVDLGPNRIKCGLLPLEALHKLL